MSNKLTTLATKAQAGREVFMVLPVGGNTSDTQLHEMVLKEVTENGDIVCCPCHGSKLVNEGLLPDEETCYVLAGAFSQNGDGGLTITEKEKGDLKAADPKGIYFTDKFFNKVAGTDGKNALKERVKWLADNVVSEWLRIDANDPTRANWAYELANIGEDARDKGVPALIDVYGDSFASKQLNYDAAVALAKLGGKKALAVCKEVLNGNSFSAGQKM